MNIPIINEPESPMKILAGEKLNTKNPSKEPANANDKDAKVYSLANTNQVPKNMVAKILRRRQVHPRHQLNSLRSQQRCK